MERLRNKLNRLSARWPASRPTSPVPEVHEPLESESTASEQPHVQSTTVHVSERLWNQAYDDLKRDSSATIVDTYEKILSRHLQTDSSLEANIIYSDHAIRWEQMKRLTSKGLENTAKNSSQKQKVNQWLELSKPLREAVGAGLKAVPQAAVPWAGICCALEILSSPLTEPTKNREGMEYVLKRMDWYWELSPWLLQDVHASNSSRPMRGQLEKQIITLYQKLLLFQMKSVILLHRSRLAVFMRDLPKVDDWAGHIKEINEAENALGVDSNQYNTLEMRTNLQEISVTAKEHAQWQRQDRLDELDNECLAELRVTNPQKDRKGIVDAKGGLFYESYRWIAENEEYKQWLAGSEDTLLWIKGDPGKGKTMLLAGIITEIEKSSPESIFYFFCQATEPRLRTATNVLRGLLWSLVRTRPHMIYHIRKEYKKEGKGAFSDSNAWQTLCDILIAILEDGDLAEACVFVIDALDECTTDRDQLLRFIVRASTSYKAKWIVSSRNWFEIEKRLDGTKRKVRLQLEMNSAAISDAVEKYVMRKVNELGAENSYSASAREEIQKHLLANADDTFLWVSLVCEELSKPDVMSHHIPTVLKSFPAGLEKLYERMVERINESRDRDLCKAALAVVGVAYRPLTLAEISSSHSILNKLSEDKNALSNIVKSCGSLLTIRGDIVYTVHQSVKDFLRSSHEVMGSGIAAEHHNVFLSSVQAMQKGLHRDLYGLNDHGALIDGIEPPKSHSLIPLQYACVHWADHFHEGLLGVLEGQYAPAFNLITTFCKQKYLYWLEAMSLLGCASEAVKAIQKVKIDVQYHAPQELRDLLEDSWRFALTHRSVMDNAPLQLYFSALIFSPETSIIRQCFKREMPSSIKVHAPSFQTWDTCLQLVPGVDNQECSLGFSPDGRHIAVISVDQYRILILDASTGGRLRSFQSVNGLLQGIAFHPDGQQLAAVFEGPVGGSTVSLYTISDGRCTGSFHTDKVTRGEVKFSPDGQLLAMDCDPPFPVFLLSDETYHLDIWNPYTKTVVQTLDTVGQRFEWISTSLGKTGLIVLSDDPLADHNIEIWDPDTQGTLSKTLTLKLHDYQQLRGIAINRERTRLALISYNSVRLCSWETDLAIHAVIEDKKYSGIAWADNDRFLIIAVPGRFGLWDLDKGMKIVCPNITPVNVLRCGRGGQIATIGGEVLSIWSLDTIAGQSKSLEGSTEKSISGLIQHPAGFIVQTAHVNSYIDGVDDHAVVEVFSRLNGDRLLQIPCAPQGCILLASNRDGSLAVVPGDKSLYPFSFDPEIGGLRPQRHFELSESAYNSAIAYGPCGKIVCNGMPIRIWDTETGQCLQKLPVHDGDYIRYHHGTAFSTSGYLAILTNGGMISIWDTEREVQIHRMDPWRGATYHVRETVHIALSADGLLALSSPAEIVVANIHQDTWLRKYKLPYSGVPSLDFELCSSIRLDTGFGVLAWDWKDDDGSACKALKLKAEDHWDPRCLSLAYTESDAWLMMGSRRVLWIPRQCADLKTFSIQSDLEKGVSTVVLVHADSVFILDVNISQI